jgi:hypothetical protein
MASETTELMSIIVPTAIATAFAAIGWIVNHILSEYRDRRNQQLAASLKYTERQLEELYGPLAFLVWEGRRTFQDLKETLAELRGKKPEDMKYIFPLSHENELNLWLFWVENDFFPRNEKIQQLLMTKTHLIEGARMPNSYLEFLDHHNSWKMDHLRWKKDKIEYSLTSKINWSEQFEKDIIVIFERLKTQHTKFLKAIANK